MLDSTELQNTFREATESLQQRVLRGRRLEWKPGMFDDFLATLRAGKVVTQTAFDSAHGIKPPKPGIEGFGAGSEQVGLTRPSAAAYPAPPTRARSTGRELEPFAHQRGRANAVSSPTLPAPPLFKDWRTAASRMGGITDSIAWVEESMVGGGDMILDPSSFQVGSMAVGFQDAASPTVQECIRGMAELLGDMGLFEQVTIDQGKEIAGEIASCLPVIGAVVTLGTGTAQVVKLILARHKVAKLNKNSKHITPGAPALALERTRALYNRHSVEMATRAATNLTAGGLAVAGLAVDMGGVSGPLMGIVRSTINLIITMTNMAITLEEMRVGNAILDAGGPFDPSLLYKCPILGTYILTEAESSTLYAFLQAKPLDPDWMTKVDQLRPKIQAVVLVAHAMQRLSPFQLVGQAAGGKAFAKGDQFIKAGARHLPKKLAHQAKMVQQRDPSAVPAFADFTKRSRP